MKKSELRAIYLEKRKSLSIDELAVESRRVAERFFSNIDLGPVHDLHTFIPIKRFNEIDSARIYKRLWSEFPSIKTISSRSDLANGEMKHLIFNSETEFVENRWGIPEIKAGEEVDPKTIDVVIVPLLCFDRQGHRVGYGKGFYDRFLSKCRPDCLKVGLSLFPPVGDIDAGTHDVSLDLAITPEEVIIFN